MDIDLETINFAKKIQQTTVFLNLKKAKQKNDSDLDLQNLINEFNLLKLQFSRCNKKGENSEEIGHKIGEVYDKIMANENMINFNHFSEKMNNLMNKINKVLMAAVNDKPLEEISKMENINETGCNGLCDNCSGCV